MHGLAGSRAAVRSAWGCSSVGRALPWHGRGRGFDPRRFHHLFRGRSSIGRARASQARGRGFDSPRLHHGECGRDYNLSVKQRCLDIPRRRFSGRHVPRGRAGLAHRLWWVRVPPFAGGPRCDSLSLLTAIPILSTHAFEVLLVASLTSTQGARVRFPPSAPVVGPAPDRRTRVTRPRAQGRRPICGGSHAARGRLANPVWRGFESRPPLYSSLRSSHSAGRSAWTLASLEVGESRPPLQSCPRGPKEGRRFPKPEGGGSTPSEGASRSPV